MTEKRSIKRQPKKSDTSQRIIVLFRDLRAIPFVVFFFSFLYERKYFFLASSREDTRECRQKAKATKCSAHMTAICNQPVYIPQTVPLFIRYCPHRDELSHYPTLLSRTRVCKKPRHHGKLAHNMQSPGIYILYILYIRNI